MLWYISMKVYRVKIFLCSRCMNLYTKGIFIKSGVMEADVAASIPGRCLQVSHACDIIPIPVARILSVFANARMITNRWINVGRVINDLIGHELHINMVQ